jgi:L,D-transpeptidase ErfK/SrfK
MIGARVSGGIAVIAIVAIAATAAIGASRWTEEDFPPRPVDTYRYRFSDRGAEIATVVGEARPYRFEDGDSLWDVARHLGLGINEVQEAMPDLDVWLPPSGETVPFPTWWVLPRTEDRGLVINVPEMRLYYFTRSGEGAGTVVTYAVGLGREDWQTPSSGSFKITEKTVNPTWVIPQSILEERIREKGRHERSIPGGHPENPLGRYRMRLSVDLFGIHGTNIPWGVGMRVSHGCIRLYPEDIERLFPLVPVGSPGAFVYQPVKLGARDGEIYLEVHHDIYELGYDFWNEARALVDAAGWADLVDWSRIAREIDRKSGVPTPVSRDRPLLRWTRDGGLSPADDPFEAASASID